MSADVQLVAAAWQVYRRRLLPADLTPEELEPLRQAYFAGAATLFHLINQTLDGGEEATASDLRRMAAIDFELAQFGAELDRKYAPHGRG